MLQTGFKLPSEPETTTEDKDKDQDSESESQTQRDTRSRTRTRTNTRADTKQKRKGRDREKEDRENSPKVHARRDSDDEQDDVVVKSEFGEDENAKVKRGKMKVPTTEAEIKQHNDILVLRLTIP